MISPKLTELRTPRKPEKSGTNNFKISGQMQIEFQSIRSFKAKELKSDSNNHFFRIGKKYEKVMSVMT